MINQRQELGKEGEDFAADYLQKQGYEIIDRNFECKQGEIDIIAKEKNEYVFIEVKTRQNFHYGMPCEAVNERILEWKNRSIKSRFFRISVRL